MIYFCQSAELIWLEASEASLTLFITSVRVPLLCPMHLARSAVGWQSFEKPYSRLFFLLCFAFFLANGKTLRERAVPLSEFVLVSLTSPLRSCAHAPLSSLCFSWYVWRCLASSVAWETWVLALWKCNPTSLHLALKKMLLNVVFCEFLMQTITAPHVLH